MTKAGLELGLNLWEILGMDSDEFLVSDLPSLPAKDIAELSRQIPRERPPIVVFSPSESVIAKRGLWTHLKVVERGIQKRIDEDENPRVIPHAVCDTIYQLDGYASAAVTSIEHMTHLLAPQGERPVNNHTQTLRELARADIAWRHSTKPDGWKPPANIEKFELEVKERFIAMCGLMRSDQEDRALAATAYHQNRIRFWRRELEYAKFNPAVHKLILAIRESGHLEPEAQSE